MTRIGWWPPLLANTQQRRTYSTNKHSNTSFKPTSNLGIAPILINFLHTYIHTPIRLELTLRPSPLRRLHSATIIRRMLLLSTRTTLPMLLPTSRPQPLMPQLAWSSPSRLNGAPLGPR